MYKYLRERELNVAYPVLYKCLRSATHKMIISTTAFAIGKTMSGMCVKYGIGHFQCFFDCFHIMDTDNMRPLHDPCSHRRCCAHQALSGIFCKICPINDLREVPSNIGQCKMFSRFKWLIRHQILINRFGKTNTRDQQ